MDGVKIMKYITCVQVRIDVEREHQTSGTRVLCCRLVVSSGV